MERSIAHIFTTGILHRVYMKMNVILKHIIIVMILLNNIACSKVLDFMAKPMLLDMTPPPGPPEYQAAYIDGCSTAMNESRYNIAASIRKSLYKHPVFNAESALYRSMWRSAYIYCGLWIPYYARKNKSSFWHVDFKLNNFGRPGTKRRQILNDAPPGPANFRQGWKDGCFSGKAATGESKHRLVHYFRKDARFIEGDGFNPEYQKGWETAFWYCQRYIDIMVDPGRRGLL